jgi:hypothetical protein
MIYFNINIRNPWWNRFESLWEKSGDTPWKNKYWEAQLMKDDELFRIEFSFTTRQDHSGVRLELGLLGYKASFTFYDSRHWNDEEGRWYVYGEEQDWPHE